MSIPHERLTVSLVEWIEELPCFTVAVEAQQETQQTGPRRRGRPRVYHNNLFYKALVVMVVRRLTSMHEFLQVLQEPTLEMRTLHNLLTCQGRFPCHRTWERRFESMPASLAEQIGILGRFLVE